MTPASLAKFQKNQENLKKSASRLRLEAPIFQT
ncbi:hypothetical protein Vi05172_g13477 [Venturia inaequalis]|nr:hypothetical protein Vi05172_g13477 [Venturia inaequalis]